MSTQPSKANLYLQGRNIVVSIPNAEDSFLKFLTHFTTLTRTAHGGLPNGGSPHVALIKCADTSTQTSMLMTVNQVLTLINVQPSLKNKTPKLKDVAHVTYEF